MPAFAPTPAARHLLACLLLTGAALVTAFALPASAHAGEGITIHINTNWGGKGIEGSRKLVTVARTIPAFTAVRVEGPIELTLHTAAQPSLSVRAEDNLEPLIETLMDGQTLLVRVKKSVSLNAHEALRVTAATPQLGRAEIQGSGDIRIEDLSGPSFVASISGSGDLRLERAKLGRLEASIAGSGDVWLSGQADSARYAIAGSGDLHAGDLAGKDVSVSISGSGDALVQATASLDASIAGSGDIRYRGNPTRVSRSIAGSGSIERQ